ncbi:MAG: SLC13 family permease [Candidatus Glassbacteria bacterium]|nr:SLC13 family permease [Candidatus Glassbacteria bacterium]
MPNWEISFTVFVLGTIFWGLLRKYPPDLLLIGGVVLCGVAGIVSPHEAFSGFANTGMLTVAALYVVVAGLTETGALEIIGRQFLGKVKSELSLIKRMTFFVPSVSAFLNNTPVVAMFIPIIYNWCKAHRVSPSRLLIPLSYLSILGGTCTLIGTSTNLVVNGLMVEQWELNRQLFSSLHPIGMFELSVVGIPYAVIGTIYLLVWGRRALPSHVDLTEKIADARREYLVNMKVSVGCRLAGRMVEEAGLRHLPGLFLIEIVRNGQVIAPVRPDEIIREQDILTFTGVASTIVDLDKIAGLEPVGETPYTDMIIKQKAGMMCEAVISNTSPLIGKTVRAGDFRAKYNAAIMAINRGDQHLRGKVGDIVLRAGDTLLIQAGPHFIRANRNNPDFYLVGGIEDSRPVRHDKAILSISLLGLLVLLMTTRVMPIVYSAFLVGGLMVATRCVSFSVARQKIDWSILVTIAAALGMGKALVNSGLVESVTGLLVNNIGGLSNMVLLALIFLLSSVFTEIITNNASAALMFPFAVSLAVQLGVDPRSFVMAVVFGASASFATPLGYQTNLMVYGPGGYRLSDFLKAGIPLNLILMLTATLLIPRFWPF